MFSSINTNSFSGRWVADVKEEDIPSETGEIAKHDHALEDLKKELRRLGARCDELAEGLALSRAYAQSLEKRIEEEKAENKKALLQVQNQTRKSMLDMQGIIQNAFQQVGVVSSSEKEEGVVFQPRDSQLEKWVKGLFKESSAQGALPTRGAKTNARMLAALKDHNKPPMANGEILRQNRGVGGSNRVKVEASAGLDTPLEFDSKRKPNRKHPPEAKISSNSKSRRKGQAPPKENSPQGQTEDRLIIFGGQTNSRKRRRRGIEDEATTFSSTERRSTSKSADEGANLTKGEALIGKSIDIFQATQNKYHKGFIVGFNKKTGEHAFHHDSGKVEMLNLKKQKCRLFDDDVPPRSKEEIDCFEDMDYMVLQSLYQNKADMIAVRVSPCSGAYDAGPGPGLVCSTCLEVAGSPHTTSYLETCSQCQVAVHAHCYNGTMLPTSTSDRLGPGWVCPKCSLGSGTEGILCLFCGQGGSIMRQIQPAHAFDQRDGVEGSTHALGFSMPRGYHKQQTKSSNQLWAHLLCARWDPDVQITSSGDLEFKQEPSTVRKTQTTCCKICGGKAGVCIKCCYPGCQMAMHAWCAKDHGHLQSGTRFGILLKIAMCAVHRNMRAFPEHICDYIEQCIGFPQLMTSSFNLAAAEEKGDDVRTAVVDALARARAAPSAVAEARGQPSWSTVDAALKTFEHLVTSLAARQVDNPDLLPPGGGAGGQAADRSCSGGLRARVALLLRVLRGSMEWEMGRALGIVQ